MKSASVLRWRLSWRTCLFFLFTRLFYLLFRLFCLFDFWFFYFMLFNFRRHNCFCLVIKIIKNVINCLLRVEAIKTTGLISILVEHDYCRVSSHLKMLPTKHRPIALTIEIKKFKVGTDLVCAFECVHVWFNISAVLAPGRKEFDYFYRTCFLDCWEDITDV